MEGFAGRWEFGLNLGAAMNPQPGRSAAIATAALKRGLKQPAWCRKPRARHRAGPYSAPGSTFPLRRAWATASATSAQVMPSSASFRRTASAEPGAGGGQDDTLVLGLKVGGCGPDPNRVEHPFRRGELVIAGEFGEHTAESKESRSLRQPL